ncbi:MAG: hypothetical protein RLZZ324_825 [Candidatus Parcubacteria bacterium]|jgi:O-antigen/teichoic acid export membrane protein
MSLSKNIATNAALQVGGRIIGTVLGLFTLGIMTRSLAPTGYGTFTTAMSFLQFFGILADFGLTITMTKLISEHGADEDSVASNVFTMRLATATVLFSIAPVAAAFFPYSSDVRAGIAVAAFSFFFMSVSQVLVGVFQKHLASHLSAAAEVLGRAMLLAGVLFSERTGAGLPGFFFAVVAGNAVQLAYSLAAVRKFVTLRFAADMAVWRKILRESWPIGLSIAFNLIYLKGDVIALSVYRTQDEVGWYGAAYKVLDVITVIPMIFMGLVLPQLTSSWSMHDHDAFARRLRRAFDALVLLAVPLAVGTFAVSTDLMTLVAGRDFAASGPILTVLMLAGSAVFVSALYGHAVVAIGLQRQMIWAYAFDAVASTVLYVTLVRGSGPLAAAWITVFSETFILCACAAAVHAKTRVMPDWRALGVAVCGSAVMFGALRVSSGIEVVARVFIGVAAYGAVVLASGVVSKDALALLGIKPRSV